MGKINDILKKKGKKPQLLQKNAFEAAAAGAQATGINLDPDKEEDNGPKKVANPITMSASSPSPLQFNTFESQGRFNYKGTPGEYFKRKLQEYKEGTALPDLSKAIKYEDSSGGPDYNKFLRDKYKSGYSIQQLVDDDYGTTEGLTDLFKDLKQGSNNPPSGQNIEEFKFVPDGPVTTNKPMSQRYNMGEKEVEDANTARGRMRRGLNREERKGMKDIVKGLDPKQRQEFRDNMKKQRNVDLDGDGKVSIMEKIKGTFGGNRQQKKLNALNEIKGVKEEFGLKDKTIRQDIAKANQDAYEFDPNSQRDMKIKAASQSKYNAPIGSYFDFKPSSSSTSNPVADPNLEDLTDDDMKKKFFEMTPEEMKAYVQSKNPSKDSPIDKRGYKGKSAGIMKRKFGRGAGYKN